MKSLKIFAFIGILLYGVMVQAQPINELSAQLNRQKANLETFNHFRDQLEHHKAALASTNLGKMLGLQSSSEYRMQETKTADFMTQYAADSKTQSAGNGLLYRVIQSGDGTIKPTSAQSTVTVHYEGKLIDGKIFDSSYQRGQTTSFKLNQVIPGWTQALQLMSVGDIWEVVIPSNLAYGDRGIPGVIPPKSVLIFKIELVAVDN